MNIYAIADQVGNVKIGVSRNDPIGRMRELQVGNASRLTLIGYGSHEHAKSLESQLHADMKKAGLSVGGEWFAPSIFTTCVANALSAGLLEEAAEAALVASGFDPWDGDYLAQVENDYQREYMRKRRSVPRET